MLLCEDCRFWFPITSNVPVLLIFPTRFHHAFATKYRERLAALNGFTPPTGTPMPGELRVQESFTDEWEILEDDPLTFQFDDRDLFQLHKEVYLGWDSGPASVKKVLNVGCGFGKEALILQRICQNARIFAVDLNLSLFQSGMLHADDRKLQFVVASLFALPFPERSFDLVYCQGVLHHTHSTRQGFRSISKHVDEHGFLFVWVYSLDDALTSHGWRSILKRTFFLSERILRPPIAALPRPIRNLVLRVFGAFLHPVLKRRERHRAIWKFKNTLHFMYDFFGPRYAHRHSYNEVIQWFEDAGFDIQVQSAKRYREIFHGRPHGVGILGVPGAHQGAVTHATTATNLL